MSYCTESSYPLLLSSQDSVDADVDHALIPPSIFAPGGKHGGYGTWQLMTSEEGLYRLAYKTCTGGYRAYRRRPCSYLKDLRTPSVVSCDSGHGVRNAIY